MADRNHFPRCCCDHPRCDCGGSLHSCREHYAELLAEVRPRQIVD